MHAPLKMLKVLHVFLLQPWQSGDRAPRPPLCFDVIGDVVFALDQKDGSRKQLKEFLTDWEGYGPEPDS